VVKALIMEVAGCKKGLEVFFKGFVQGAQDGLG
jgi:hypothetical protein